MRSYLQILRVVAVAASALAMHTTTASAQCAPYLSSRSLDFTSSTPGSLLDQNGVGTGFRTRLGGTGASYGASDPQLELDQSAGELRLTSTNSDLNGQFNLGVGVYPGINLSSLGFTGTQDFCVSARFTDIRYDRPYDQFGLYVGGSSASAVRAGYLHTVVGREAFNVWTLGGFDQAIVVGVGPTLGSELDIVISRIAGVFSMQVGGMDLSSNFGGASLNALSDLTVGVFAANARNNVPQIGTLTDFAVGVDAAPVSVPEPASLSLMLFGVAGCVVRCIAKRANCAA